MSGLANEWNVDTSDIWPEAGKTDSKHSIKNFMHELNKRNLSICTMTFKQIEYESTCLHCTHTHYTSVPNLTIANEQLQTYKNYFSQSHSLWHSITPFTYALLLLSLTQLIHTRTPQNPMKINRIYWHARTQCVYIQPLQVTFGIKHDLFLLSHVLFFRFWWMENGCLAVVFLLFNDFIILCK